MKRRLWTMKRKLEHLTFARGIYGDRAPFFALLEDLWIKIKGELTGQPYERKVLFNPNLRLNHKKFKHFLSIQHRSRFWKFFIDVSQLIIDCHCTNSPFIADFLQLACEICNATRITNPTSLVLQLYKSCSPRRIRKYTSNLEKLMYLPYRTAHNEVMSDFDEVKRAATSGNIGFLEILLKFGVTLLRPRLDCPDEEVYVMEVMEDVFNENLYLEYYPYLVVENLLEFSDDVRSRFYLMMRVLDVIPKIRNQPEYAMNYVECINLLFKSIPDPIFTVNEIENSLKKVCKYNMSQQEISSLCSEYKKFFPESCEPSGPRSLQHLCRSQIRDSLRSHRGCLCVNINSLPLPSSLKKYILLKNDKKLVPKPIIFTPTLKDEYEQITQTTIYLYFLPEDY